MKARLPRLLLDAAVLGLTLLFTCALLWLLNGSLETAPAAEQQDKARMGALLLMCLFGIPDLICVALRLRLRGKPTAQKRD